MPEITRLSGSTGAIGLDFVEREATPTEMMELAIYIHLDELSLSDTVSIFDKLGISRARSTVHNWVQMAVPEPRGGRDLEKIALVETVVKVNSEQFWLVAAVESDTNVILYFRLYTSRNTAVTKIFLREIREIMPSRMRDFCRWRALSACWPLRVGQALPPRNLRRTQPCRTCLSRDKTLN